MSDHTYEDLQGSVAAHGIVLTGDSRLEIPHSPSPFVGPTLRSFDSASGLANEVILVRAPAAVGKTTLARALASDLQIPFLDLSRVPVGSGSLLGLISADVDDPNDPVSAFHAGKLPIVIDALDEGRLLSGDDGFLEFLETTSNLVMRDRSSTGNPKLIVFGRGEAVDDTRWFLEAASDAELSICTLEIEFFDEDRSREVVHAYAERARQAEGKSWLRPEPAERALSLFFEAIQAALELDEDGLWASPDGRAFAGYAPVLDALGTILADESNHQRLVASLQEVEAAAGEAWDVMEDVIQTILHREQEKLAEKLRQRGVESPENAYDPQEQLRLLAFVAEGRSPSPTAPDSLSGRDAATYRELVEQWLPEHAFLREGELANPVFASTVFAFAVIEDLLEERRSPRLSKESRNPFVWRSFERRIEAESLIDGRYVGVTLHSFWNDPLELDRATEVRVQDAVAGESVVVEIPRPGQPATEFQATLPVEFFGLLRKADVRIQGKATWRGRSEASGQSSIEVRGDPLVFSCRTLEVDTDVIRFVEGDSWVSAQEHHVPGDVQLKVENGADVGWGEALEGSWPWRDYPSTYEPASDPQPADAFEELLVECQKQFATRAAGVEATVLTLEEGFEPTEDDPRMDWVSPGYAEAFPALIDHLVGHGLASAERDVKTSGQANVRVRLNTSWSDLAEAARSPAITIEREESGSGNLAAFIRDARPAINELVQARSG